MEDLAAAPAVANVENFCSTRLEPHSGHSGVPWLRLKTSFSKAFPHFRQAYSKMGMVASAYSLGWSPQPESRSDRARGGGAQVKRESPGMRGSTRK